MKNEYIGILNEDFFKTKEFKKLLIIMKSGNWNKLDIEKRKEVLKSLNKLVFKNLNKEEVPLAFSNYYLDEEISMHVDINKLKVLSFTTSRSFIEEDINNFSDIIYYYFRVISKAHIYEMVNRLSYKEAEKLDLLDVKKNLLFTPYGENSFNKLASSHELYDFQAQEILIEKTTSKYLKMIAKEYFGDKGLSEEVENMVFSYLLIRDDKEKELVEEANSINAKNFEKYKKQEELVNSLFLEKIANKKISDLDEEELYLLASGVFEHKLLIDEKEKIIKEFIKKCNNAKNLSNFKYDRGLLMFSNWIRYLCENVDIDKIVKDSSLIEDYNKYLCVYEIIKKDEKRFLKKNPLFSLFSPLNIVENIIYEKELDKMFTFVKKNIKDSDIIDFLHSKYGNSETMILEKAAYDYSGKNLKSFYKEEISPLIDKMYRDLKKVVKTR